MKIEHLPLNVDVTDTATGLTGRLVHLNIETGDQRYYNFQPRGLNPETGQPAKRIWLAPARIKDLPPPVVTELPVEVLGTKVTDDASGFTGKAVAITLHPSGCVHVLIQPSGALAKTGDAIESCDFDIRRVSGPAIPKLTDDQLAESERRHPSPSGSSRCGPRDL